MEIELESKRDQPNEGKTGSFELFKFLYSSKIFIFTVTLIVGSVGAGYTLVTTSVSFRAEAYLRPSKKVIALYNPVEYEFLNDLGTLVPVRSPQLALYEVLAQIKSVKSVTEFVKSR